MTTLRSRGARLFVTALVGLDLLGGTVVGAAHADSALRRSVEVNADPLLVQAGLEVRVRGARVVQAKGRRRASLTLTVEVGAGTPSVTTTAHQQPTEECAVGDDAVAGTVNRVHGHPTGWLDRPRAPSGPPRRGGGQRDGGSHGRAARATARERRWARRRTPHRSLRCLTQSSGESDSRRDRTFLAP